MRIDLPCCGFKNCKYCFDGNCTKPSEQEKCEYWHIMHKESEVTRCKDCKWKQGSECVRFAEVRPFPDDYCSRAERRGEEE